MANEQIQDKGSVDMILILGETGVGKSTFINAAGPVGKTAVVGHLLESCTTAPEGYLIDDGKRRVILVDTPGFNDTNIEMSDDVTLKVIIKWLQDAFRRDETAKLAGIIYLHDITNVESRVPKLVDANKLRIPPSVVLTTVQCHNGHISEHLRGQLRQRYPRIFTGDHFGYNDGQATALALIDKVIESHTTAPLSFVIEKLQELMTMGKPTPVKSKRFSVRKIVRDLLSSFKRK